MTDVFILLALIFLNGLFVMSEIALVSARKSRLENLASKGDAHARVALDLANNPDLFLSAAQIGITLIAILTGVYSGERFGVYLKPVVEKFDRLRPYAGTISTSIIVVIVTFLSIIFGELIPKRLGLQKAERLARRGAADEDVAAIRFQLDESADRGGKEAGEASEPRRDLFRLVGNDKCREDPGDAVRMIEVFRLPHVFRRVVLAELHTPFGHLFRAHAHHGKPHQARLARDVDFALQVDQRQRLEPVALES